jgi:hypothetical protein
MVGAVSLRSKFDKTLITLIDFLHLRDWYCDRCRMQYQHGIKIIYDTNN